jgi:hypothetical protein
LQDKGVIQILDYDFVEKKNKKEVSTEYKNINYELFNRIKKHSS